MLLYDVVSRAYNCVSQFEFKWRLIYHTACDITRYPIHNDWWHDEDAINHHKAHALEILRHTHPYIQPNILTIIQVDIQIYNPAYQGSVFAFWDRELVREPLRTAREQLSFAQSVSSRINLLTVCKLAMFRDFYKTRVLWGIFWKISRISAKCLR